MNEQAVAQFKRKIAKHLKLRLDLVINENRSTMLNVLEKRRDSARLSMHRMFLEAPDTVISAIAHYVRGTRRIHQEQNLVLRSFIQKSLQTYDYSTRIDQKKLIHQGRVYDVGLLYETINRQYFDGKLALKITWYGQWGKRSASRVIFGQYYDALKLVKIHRVLDDPFFPDYFVAFVVYHEMLHSVVPGYTDASGRFRTHGELFKQREKEFEHYAIASEWERKNRPLFFRSRSTCSTRS